MYPASAGPNAFTVEEICSLSAQNSSPSFGELLLPHATINDGRSASPVYCSNVHRGEYVTYGTGHRILGASWPHGLG